MLLDPMAEEVALRLRGYVGDKNVGPAISEIVELFSDLGPGKLFDALKKLERAGFIRFDEGMRSSTLGKIPKELRNVAGLQVLEPLQEYFDKIGS